MSEAIAAQKPWIPFLLRGLRPENSVMVSGSDQYEENLSSVDVDMPFYGFRMRSLRGGIRQRSE